MNFTGGFLLIVGLLMAGFVSITVVLLFMTDENASMEQHKIEEKIQNYRKQYYLFKDDHDDVKPTTRSTLVWSIKPSPSSVLPTTPTTQVKVATTIVDDDSDRPVSSEKDVATSTTPDKTPNRMSPFTLRVNHSIFQGIDPLEFATTATAPLPAFSRASLSLIHEIKPLDNTKVSSMLLHDSLLYLATTAGTLVAYNLTDYSVVETTQTPLALHHFGFLSDGRIVATEVRKSTLSTLDVSGRVTSQLKLDFDSKDMQVVDDKIFVLSRSNRDIFMFNHHLRLRQSIHFKNELMETCNFIVPTNESVFVSCQSGILEVAMNGTTVREYSIPGSSYSLAVHVLTNSVLAVQRGTQEIHAYDRASGQLSTKFVSSASGPAIWSSLALFENKLCALEYMTNIVKVFLLP